VCKHVVALIGDKLAKEMKAMCAKVNNSILHQPPVDAVQSFWIEDVINEMEQLAPYTLTLLCGCLGGHRQPKAKNICRKGQTRVRMFDIDRIVAVCCAIILKGRSQRMNLLQRIVSMIFILWTCS